MEPFIDEANGVFLSPTISSRIEAMAEFFEIEPSRFISFLLRGLTNPHDTATYEVGCSGKKALMIIRKHVYGAKGDDPAFDPMSIAKVDLAREFSQQLKISHDKRLDGFGNLLQNVKDEAAGRAYCFYQHLTAWSKQEKKGVAK